MIDRLYVARGDRTSGPFSAAQLRGLAAAGRIRATDTVWREGAIDKSVAAVKVKNLFPSPPTPAPAFAPQILLDSPPPPVDPVEMEAEPAPVQTVSVPPASAVLLDAGDPTSKGGASPQVKTPRPPPEAVRKRRAIALKGAIILSQDGMTVHYRKKCTQCGFEDRCRSSLPIGNGMTRVHFYCPECRKGRDVQIQGIMQ